VGAIALVVVSVLVMVKTRWSPIWLVALGAVAGMLGLV
jgi:chromate transporter